ncbi:MAG TPA: aminotransferase class V-fold PLP-dependent enzyme, partial [Thermomicrobiaceae bacterium]|nr:aminotransferase class V-fold PLP-dependent enzyme [Thermomicrobiaceae bacterium]
VIYLDNAATSWPKPEPVYAALESFLRTAGANPGRGSHVMAARAAATLDETRRKLARIIGVADPRRIVFASNTTDALNLAIKGLLRPGDHAVTTVMEHNSVRRPLRALRDQGVDVSTVAADAEGITSPEDFTAALRPETRLVVLTHASNVNGAVQPVAEIAAAVRAHSDAFLLVDAAQTLGALPFTMDELDADLLAFPGHKGLMGPPGTGGLAIGPRVRPDDLRTVREGGTGGNSEEDVQPAELPNRYEAGTLNTVGIAALGAAAEVVLELGVPAIRAHEAALVNRLVDGLEEIPGVRVLAPRDPERRAAVVSFLIEGWEPVDIGAALDSSFGIACRTGLHCAPDACKALGASPGGTVRFSPGYFTTEAEIDQALEAVEQLARATWG